MVNRGTCKAHHHSCSADPSKLMLIEKVYYKCREHRTCMGFPKEGTHTVQKEKKKKTSSTLTAAFRETPMFTRPSRCTPLGSQATGGAIEAMALTADIVSASDTSAKTRKTTRQSVVVNFPARISHTAAAVKKMAKPACNDDRHVLWQLTAC